MAKWESRKFLTEVLDNITDANLEVGNELEGATHEVDNLFRLKVATKWVARPLPPSTSV